MYVVEATAASAAEVTESKVTLARGQPDASELTTKLVTVWVKAVGV